METGKILPVSILLLDICIITMKSDFNFSRFGDDHYLITNYAGRYAFLSTHDFESFCNGYLPAGAESVLKANLFYSDSDDEVFFKDYAKAIRSYRDYLFMGTGLHIFVLTSACNLKCVYCQASTCDNGKMMTEIVAEKSVDLALQSPNEYLSFEFQGGEPLLNFEVLKHIVLYTEANKGDKTVEFNLVSNLSLLTDEIIDFLKEHCVSVSTSLDGNQQIQNHNRSMPSADSYQIWKSQTLRYKERTGNRIGAIQTTTNYALPFYKELVDAYIDNGFDRVFIRPLTPLGYAATRWDAIGYTPDEFLTFYSNAFDYILQKNREGFKLAEGHAVIFLNKIINHCAGNYTELRSPCGAGYGGLQYVAGGIPHVPESIIHGLDHCGRGIVRVQGAGPCRRIFLRRQCCLQFLVFSRPFPLIRVKGVSKAAPPHIAR